MKTLVLASSSPYRKQQLAKLGLPFDTASPNIDESPTANEDPQSLVERLALQKAQALELQYKNALIIGSDQVAVVNGDILGKPGNHERATEQLCRFSGSTVTFLTAVCLIDSTSNDKACTTVATDVYFRTLSEQEIDTYLKREKPYDCAGSFKSEGLGIMLFDKVVCEDPSALIGLPLIALGYQLRQFGVNTLLA